MTTESLNEWNLRPVAQSDVELLRTGTFINVNWTGEQRFTYRDIDDEATFRHYFDFRPQRGDFGMVGFHDGVALGVVWLLFLEASSPGFGFVDDGIPELSIAVWPGYRGQGIGRALMEAALAEARTRGLRRVCLSVEEGNPARFLYESLGFERAPDRDEGTYIAEL